MKRFKEFIGRLKALWFILRYRNFILIYDIKEIEIEGEKGRQLSSIRRTDYNTESDFYSMKASMIHQFGPQILDEDNAIGDYKPII